MALLSLQLFVLTLLLHRFASLATPVAVKLFGLAVLGAILAVLLGITALVRIWRDGSAGAGRAIVALVAAGMVIAGPAWSLPNILFLPRINDVSTDDRSPPEFQKLARVHEESLKKWKAPDHPGAAKAEAYPDLKPLVVERSEEEVFAIAREAASNLGWTVVSETAPKDGRPGVIEAIDRSLIFGFTADVAIRVQGGNRRARVDVRSASRHGTHDLGRNAERIKDLFSEIHTTVARMERTEKMERVARLRAERERLAKNREERARKTRAYDTLTQGWRKKRVRSRASYDRRKRRKRKRRRQSTRELRRFWDRMAN